MIFKSNFFSIKMQNIVNLIFNSTKPTNPSPWSYQSHEAPESAFEIEEPIVMANNADQAAIFLFFVSAIVNEQANLLEDLLEEELTDEQWMQIESEKVESELVDYIKDIIVEYMVEEGDIEREKEASVWMDEIIKEEYLLLLMGGEDEEALDKEYNDMNDQESSDMDCKEEK